MSGATVHLGFEVGTGKPVAIPLKHMVVTGQTQEAGKTTTLEALIARSQLRAVTFVTKRGEGAFGGGRRLAPFFRERADWVFVSSLIDATLGEKNKLLRAWLMKVCRGTKTLAEVQRNVIAAKATARGFSESIYTEIEGYLDLVVPQLAQLPPARAVEIGPGLNVMDLAKYSTELQALVIRSVLEHVYEHEEGVVTVIPEAWEFLPEGRGSPVKREAETLIRKGAGLGNYVWLDSQDLAGVWKLAVRAAPVVLVGVQREANEIKRTLANIPAGIAKPSAAAVARLQLGEFFACWGSHTIKVYVQPAWATEEKARAVALGDNALPPRPAVQTSAAVPDGPIDRVARTVEPFAPREITSGLREMAAGVRTVVGAVTDVTLKEDAVTEQQERELRARIAQLEADNNALRDRLAAYDRARGDRAETPAPKPAPTVRRAQPSEGSDEAEELYQAIKRRLVNEAPALLKVLTVKPELEVTVERATVAVDGKTLRGRIAQLLAAGFLDKGLTANAVQKELARLGKDPGPGNTYNEMKALAELGFVTMEEGRDDRGRKRTSYQAVPGMKVRIVEAA